MKASVSRLGDGESALMTVDVSRIESGVLQLESRSVDLQRTSIDSRDRLAAADRLDRSPCEILDRDAGFSDALDRRDAGAFGSAR